MLQIFTDKKKIFVNQLYLCHLCMPAGRRVLFVAGDELFRLVVVWFCSNFEDYGVLSQTISVSYF